eukprot:875657-Rhodomonas_salina.2
MRGACSTLGKLLRVRYAIPGTDSGYPPTHALLDPLYWQWVSSYTFLTQSPVLRAAMRLGICCYARATRCPVLRAVMRLSLIHISEPTRPRLI